MRSFGNLTFDIGSSITPVISFAPYGVSVVTVVLAVYNGTLIGMPALRETISTDPCINVVGDTTLQQGQGSLSATTSVSNTPGCGEQGIPKAAIIGAAVGGAVVLGIIVALIIVLATKRERDKRTFISNERIKEENYTTAYRLLDK